MSEEREDLWERIRKQLSSPWDWVAAGAGAAAGLGASILIAGADLGTSAAIGALSAVSARQAGVSALRGRTLETRVKGLVNSLESSGSPQCEALVAGVRRDQRLWRGKAISNEQFSALLDEHVQSFRAINAAEINHRLKGP